jgi:hypothetical protein
MGIWGFLGGLVEPVTKMVDDLHTSEEEKLQVKEAMFKVQAALTEKVLDYEKNLLNARADIVKAEATGGSWLKQSWRPITMLTFLVLVVCDAFGLLATPLAKEAWTLLQLGLGGYVVGRSAEKIMPNVASAMKGKGRGDG